MKKIITFLTAAVVIFSVFTLSAFAAHPTDFPRESDPPTLWNVVIQDRDGEYTLYTFYPQSATNINNSDWSATIENYSTGDYKITVTSTKNYFYEIYKVENNAWVEYRERSSVNGGTPTDFAPIKDIVYSDIDVYKDGELFFPLPPKPLYQTITEVGAATLQNTAAPAVASTMKILILCGVGLMALLIALPVFGKIFNRYRS